MTNGHGIAWFSYMALIQPTCPGLHGQETGERRPPAAGERPGSRRDQSVQPFGGSCTFGKVCLITAPTESPISSMRAT